MKRLLVCVIALSGFAAADLHAQDSARGARPAATAAAPQLAAAPTPKPAATVRAKPAEKDPVKAAFGARGGPAVPPGQPIVTEIYSDQASFDSHESIGVFTGHVVVNDPRFNIQADKLTVTMTKGEDQGLEKAIAEGNVGVVRDRPGEDGAPPERAIGRADKAVYTPKDGNVELSGTPRVQSGLNTHVATSPETVMVINQAGQLTTRGPSRTELRQEPKASPAPKP